MGARPLSRRAVTLDMLGPSARRQAEDALIAETLRAVKEKAAPKPKRKHKYGAIPKVVDDIWFPSTLEADHYAELKLRERAGEIYELERQPRFPIVVNGIALAEYRADFAYRVTATGGREIIDCKGVRTPLYRLKKRLVETLHGITIIEVTAK